AGNTVWRVAAADGTAAPASVGTDGLTQGAPPLAATGDEPAGTAPTEETGAAPPSGSAPDQPAEAPSPATPGQPEDASSSPPSQTEIAPATLPEGTVQGSGPAT